jgi:hypothetical protein
MSQVVITPTDLDDEFEIVASKVNLKIDGTLRQDGATGAIGVNPAAIAIGTEMSVVGDGLSASKVKLENDLAAPGNWKLYGTNGAGAKGWQNGAIASIVGQIVAFATDTIPAGYKAMNGQTLTGGVALYPILAGMYPGWVVGADLVLPDLRTDGGRFLRSAGTGRLVNSMQADATAVNGLSVASAGAHSHTYQRTDPAGEIVSGGVGAVVVGIENSNLTRTTSTDGAHAHSLTGDTETRPTNYAVWWAVATDDVLVPMADTINVSVNPINPIANGGNILQGRTPVAGSGAGAIALTGGGNPTFVTNGGKILLTATGTLYSSAANNWCGISVLVDGVVVSTANMFVNPAATHFQLSQQVYLSNLAAGTHTLSFARVGATAITDAADVFSASFIEVS